MVEVNETYENEISLLHEKFQDNEREKSQIINDYELKILKLKN